MVILLLFTLKTIKMAKNKLAGEHPSYDKVNMSPERRKKKIAQ
jgi:hypothetical protein